MIRWVLLLVIIVVAFAAWNKKRPADTDPAVAAINTQTPLKNYTLTEVDAGYSETVLHGWRVLVSKPLLEQDGPLALQVLNLLDNQLNTIQSKVPLKAVQAFLTPGALVEALEVPAATLSFHLKELTHAGLVRAERDGRRLIYRPSLDHMNHLLDYLTAHCCQGQACEIAPAPGCRPA